LLRFNANVSFQRDQRLQTGRVPPDAERTLQEPFATLPGDLASLAARLEEFVTRDSPHWER
jgi:hypothetical protein